MKTTRKKATGALDNILRKAGYATLAKELGLSVSTPWHWAKEGLPASTYKGENDYAKVIARLVREAGYECTMPKVFEASNNVRRGKRYPKAGYKCTVKQVFDESRVNE